MSQTPIDRVRADIDRIFIEHPTLRYLSRNDAEVYAWFQMAAKGACTVEEALVGALVRTCETKDRQLDEIIKLKVEAAK